MYWTYRLIKGKDIVYIGEVYYNEQGEPELCSENPMAVEGYDYDYGMDDSGSPFDVTKAAEDTVTQLKMMLEDIEKFPAVIDPDTDLVGIE